MNSEIFDRVSTEASRDGARAAFTTAERAFASEKDFHRLFDLLLMMARYDLGLPLFLRTPATTLLKEIQEAYEPKVVEAARRVGEEFLKESDLTAALPYFNMIGELEPMRRALEHYQPDDDANELDAVVDLAVSHGVHPRRGLELVVERMGLCQGITTCEQLMSQGLKTPERDECIQLLVRTLYEELSGRLRDEIDAKEGRSPVGIPQMTKGRDWLFADDAYHVDTSHLSAVVRMARLSPKCEETFLAIQLCEYGKRLSPRYRYAEAPPFEDVFASSATYLKALAGMETEKALEYFRSRADATSADDVENYAAEVYVHLLTSLGRTADAVAYAGRKLNRADRRSSMGMSVNDLCQQSGDFEAMARLAKERGDLLGYVAGIVQRGDEVPKA